jgi:spore maturation protein CgeB
MKENSLTAIIGELLENEIEALRQEHEGEREEIAVRGQEEVHQKHTYERRIQEILSVTGIRRPK